MFGVEQIQENESKIAFLSCRMKEDKFVVIRIVIQDSFKGFFNIGSLWMLPLREIVLRVWDLKYHSKTGLGAPFCFLLRLNHWSVTQLKMIFAPHSSRRSRWRSSGQISILAGKIKIWMDINDVSDFKYRRRGIVLNCLVTVYFGSTPMTFDLSHRDKTDKSHSSLAFTWDQLAYRGINLFNSSPTQLKPLIEGRHISLLIELLLLQLDVWTSWGAFRKESSSFLRFSCSSVPSRFVSWIYSFIFSIFNLFYPNISPGSSRICLHRSTRCLYLMTGTICCSGPNGHYYGAGTTWSLLVPAAGITQSVAQITAGTGKNSQHLCRFLTLNHIQLVFTQLCRISEFLSTCLFHGRL